MYTPWQMRPVGYPMMKQMLPRRVTMPLMETASGAFPVPESLSPDRFPPAVKEAVLRVLEGPPKPAVSLAVMNKVQETMIAPDLPWKANI